MDILWDEELEIVSALLWIYCDFGQVTYFFACSVLFCNIGYLSTSRGLPVIISTQFPCSCSLVLLPCCWKPLEKSLEAVWTAFKIFFFIYLFLELGTFSSSTSITNGICAPSLPFWWQDLTKEVTVSPAPFCIQCPTWKDLLLSANSSVSLLGCTTVGKTMGPWELQTQNIHAKPLWDLLASIWTNSAESPSIDSEPAMATSAIMCIK